MTNYTVEHFISKFQNTRDDKWTVNNLHKDGKACALGWCGVDDSGFRPLEGIALINIMDVLKTDFIKARYGNVPAAINNGDHQNYQQPTPKQRILAALYDIRAMLSKEQKAEVCDATKSDSSNEAGKIKTIIKYVSVAETIKDQSKSLILS